MAALSHPNIVAIYDVGTHQGIPYAASELLEGETLGSRIGVSALPLGTALDLAVQIGRGLAAAHDVAARIAISSRTTSSRTTAR